MAIDPISSFQSSKLGSAVCKKADSFCQKTGEFLENSPIKDKFYKAMKHIDPTGANNAFIPMATLMIGTVIVPRVLTAAKRNPNDKEATRDEIQEILFRDIQTVLIVLFALKSVNSLVAATTTKITGLPMTQKPYEALFDSKEKGLKGIGEKAEEFIAHPVQKLKILGKNILDTIHPTEGVRALTNDEFSSRYSNFNSIGEIKKLLAEIGNEKGNPDKVFNTIIDELINAQKALIANNAKSVNAGFEADSSKAQEILNALEELKKTGISGLCEDKLDSHIQDQLLEYFRNPENKLVQKAKGLNGWLRTGALAFEAAYLGFGLPALNEKRLEKKYLSKDSTSHFEYSANKTANNPLLDKHIKANEVKLYHNFIK